MIKPKKLPYGLSHYKSLIREGFIYIDKTAYIEELEDLGPKFLIFLRPRRFGKSLFLSTLGCYYDLKEKESFQELFGNLYIGQNPTPGANSYMILDFEFSRINTDTDESTFKGFLGNVRSGVDTFMKKYNLWGPEERQEILSNDKPNSVLIALIDKIKNTERLPQIYVLIDEYDHFSNEILARSAESFSRMTASSGFVRKFYEALKTAAGDGLVGRMFITGVTPITLDSLTSGFNISADLSRVEHFAGMMGFGEEEARLLVEKACQNQNCDIPKIMSELKAWYDGYLFYEDAPHVYNPDMLLHYVWHLQKYAKPPKEMLDTNIASDYGKLRRLFALKNKEQNQEVLREIVEKGEIVGEIVPQFSFERAFTKNDFLSMLYYMGYVSIRRGELAGAVFGIPNFVIHRLYLDYFMSLIAEQAGFGIETWDVAGAMRSLAIGGDPAPVCLQLQDTLKKLSNRDAPGFSEKHVKAVFVGLINLANVYFIKSEYETDKKFVDVLLLERPSVNPKWQFAIELKYLPKKDAAQTARVKKEAIAQLKGYLEREDLKKIPNLKAFVAIVVGDEVGFENVQ